MRRVRARRIVLFIALSALVGVPAHSQAPVQPPGRSMRSWSGAKYAKSSELRELHCSEGDMDELRRYSAWRLPAREYRADDPDPGRRNTRFLPIAANIRKELKALLRDRIEADSVLVAFAGHGVQFRARRDFFCPADGRLDDTARPVAPGGLPGSGRVQGAVQAAPERRLPQRPDRGRSRRDERQLGERDPAAIQRPPGGVAALFSCSAGETGLRERHLEARRFLPLRHQGPEWRRRFRQGRANRAGRADLLRQEAGPGLRRAPSTTVCD